MKKVFLKRLAAGAAASLCAVTMVACGGGEAAKTTSGTGPSNPSGATYDNETTPLTLSTQALDGVFNPFFYTSGYDGEIVGSTQIGMLSTDSNGSVKVGDDEPCVVKDYNITTTDERTDKTDKEDYDNYYTTYEFVIKNDIKFADGTPLTIQDVLFNMYVLLDPVYTGSTTMYSTNIKGLKAYRAQSLDAGEQENAEAYFNQKASERIENIQYYCDDDDLNDPDQEAVKQVLKDIETMKPLFKKELESDWNNAEASISSYADSYKFDSAWQVFLFMYGYISIKPQKDDVWDGENTEVPEALNWNGWDERGPKMTKDEIINAVYENMVNNPVEKTRKDNIWKIVTYYATAENLRNELIAQEKSAYYEEAKQSGQLLVPNISGITVDTTKQFYTIDGKTVNYDSNHSVLKIVVNGVDPKAIWNFSFTVAPMHYYSTASEVAKASIDNNNFGVSFGNKDFMDQLQGKLVPMGAGVYKVTTRDGHPENVKEVKDFYNDNVVYFERNTYFYKPAKIKNLRYKVISSNKLYDAVKTGDVDYADPSAKVETVNDIKANYANKMGYKLVDNLGYGYIGVNASKISALEVRRAIMYAMDTSLVLQYYTNEMASIIERPMSSVSWAYPKGATSYYEFVGKQFTSEADQIAFITDLVESAGFTKNSSGIYHRTNPISKQDEKLEYTFSLAGETNDHPAYNTFAKAKTILEKCGFKITVTNDPNALSKLSNGSLTVWAAAWSSTIDPDMYQVYHKDSKATSVNNWGYPYLSNHSSNAEIEDQVQIIEDLSLLIDQGRETTVQAERKEIYRNALDKVMELAVELPTYQRKNLFVYNKAKIDENTLCKDITPYNGPLSRIWEVSFVK